MEEKMSEEMKRLCDVHLEVIKEKLGNLKRTVKEFEKK